MSDAGVTIDPGIHYPGADPGAYPGKRGSGGAKLAVPGAVDRRAYLAPP